NATPREDAFVIWLPMAVPLVKVHQSWFLPSDFPDRASALCAASKLPSLVAPNQIRFRAFASFKFMQVAESLFLPETPSPATPALNISASPAGWAAQAAGSI